MIHGSNTIARPQSKSQLSRHDRICRIVQRNVRRVAWEVTHPPLPPSKTWRRAA
jgi:hypothetical protein